MLAAFFPFLGSGALRQDLRLDLPRIELLKSYRLVILGGNLLVLAVGLLPAAVVFVPLYLPARHFGSNAFVLAMSTAPTIAVLLTEIWIAVRFLGTQFDQIDITNEIDDAL